MRKERGIQGIPIEEGSRNVYADLGYADSEDMVVKAQLVTKIADIIRQRGLTQQRAAKLLGLTQPKISRLLKGQFRGISERRLLRCLTRLEEGRRNRCEANLAAPWRTVNGSLCMRARVCSSRFFGDGDA